MQGDRQEPCRGDRLCGADKVVDDMRRFILAVTDFLGEYGAQIFFGALGGITGALIVRVIAMILTK